MPGFLFVLGLLGVVAGAPRHDVSPKIINGTNANDGEFPYMVSLRKVRDGEQHECGGSIISERWILTAAHCVWGQLLVSVRYGSVRLDEGHVDYNYTMPIKTQIVHPDYTNIANDSGWFMLNDVALLELQDPLPFGPDVGPVQLPDQDDPEPVGSTGVLSGWGNIDDHSTQPEVLQKIDQILYDQEFCSAYFAVNSIWYYDRYGFVCGGVPGELRRACFGDSGGPLVVDGVQRGMVSMGGTRCAVSPTIFTRVSVVRDWIRTVTGT
ncbi:chymotrypsin-2-like [Cylas formicarius]|uniref:chymotrypsin-2-like n=1 Tax=Cylas formicarius TaxID=197179 RepID=UPI0029585366|nr:chymotrypsin-2-like [Cylas formicarius]